MFTLVFPVLRNNSSFKNLIVRWMCMSDFICRVSATGYVGVSFLYDFLFRTEQCNQH